MEAARTQTRRVLTLPQVLRIFLGKEPISGPFRHGRRDQEQEPRDPDSQKSPCSEEEARATEEQERAALTETTRKPEESRKTRRRRAAEQTSRRPRRCNKNPPATLLEKRGTLRRASHRLKRAQEGLGGRENPSDLSGHSWLLTDTKAKPAEETEEYIILVAEGL
ncbi:hypothetical protein NDU88_002636 [Pleurodeles waltl]|uniref:Uncharacterized protein n=1 Tax=Pleurodeles waltl TaxID=8319 RepID=A0AAV7VF47_PLEWA|nr:hypothetical protein NDU88_002636 [Pleurodeles waltl]